MANNTLLASDNFASGSLAAGWAAVPGLSVCQVIAGPPNYTEPNSLLTLAGQIWTGLTWPNDQSSEITVTMTGSAVATTLIHLHVRNQGGASYSGYRAIVKDSGAWEIDVVTAGTPTTLNSGTGLTIAANDTFTFQAAGVCLALYHNFTLVGYFYDTTYMSGSPGYSQEATTTLSTNKVFSWRGYNAVQQDGIWQKQGIVIAPVIGDLNAGVAGQGLQLISMLREGNAQILSGTVYKAWLISNWGASSNIFYAESSDGITWSRMASAVLANYVNASVYKDGSTYYLYAQATAANGTGNIFVFTSTDGVTWGAAHDTGIGLGGAGTWDHVNLYSIVVVDKIGSTYYGMYTGTNNASTFLFSSGLVTSTNLLDWTKYVSNPVLVNSLPCAFAKVGTTYYGWFASNQPQGDSHAPDLDPSETVRYQSTDLITWTNPVHSVHHSQMYESVNTVRGQVFPATLFTVGAQTYMYVDSVMSDGVAPTVGQISLAIAPAPISSIVQFNEDAVSQVALDPFTSGTGNLSGNWTGPTYAGSGNAKIIAGNLCEATNLNEVDIAVYTGASFGADQYTEVTLKTLSNAGDQLLLIVRASSSALTFYQASLNGPTGTANNVTVSKWVAGVNTTIGPAANAIKYIPNANDVFRLQVTDNVLSLFQNGFLILQAEDVSNSITSGNPGFYFYDTVAIANAQISKWAGGNANVIPNYPPIVNSGAWVQAFRGFVNKRGVS